MPHDVFLSYASADRAAADAVCAALEARGIPCWMAPRDVPAGADWGEAILTAIGRAHAMVLILSRHTAGSVHVKNEVVTAVSQSLALVPVRIEDCQPGGALRLHLAGSHWLNIFPPPFEQHADALAAGVRLALAADATIELPRAQAAALVAAARAAAAAGPLPVAAARPPAPRPGRPAAAAPQPAASRAAAMADHAPHRPSPAAGRGAALVLAVIAVAVVVAIGAAAWVYEPQLRALLGAAPAAPPVVAAATPAPQAAAGPEAPPAPPLPGFALPFRLPPLAQTPSTAAPDPAGIAPAAPPGPIAAAPPPPAPAARLFNAAQDTISRLFVAPAAQGLGQEDWLGSAQITPGNAVLLRPPAGEGCVFNIRVVYVGGRTEDRPGVDLCSAAELRFDGSKAVARSSRP